MKYNNEDIEIVYLTDEPVKNQDNKKKIKSKSIIYICIGVSLIILLICIFIVVKFIFSVNKTEKLYKNEIGKKNVISTTLDLEGIFDQDDNYYSMYKENNINKAIINKDKIYYSYSPSYCYYDALTCERCREIQTSVCNESNRNKEECSVSYCDQICNEDRNEDILCDKYFQSGNKFEDLMYRYVLVSNLDGSLTKELISHKLADPITFDYKDEKIALYYSIADKAIYSLDFSKEKITKSKDNMKVASYPISNLKETVLIDFDNNFYTLNYYKYNDFSKVLRKEKIYNSIYNDYILRIDEYNNNDIYSISSGFYDKNITDDYNGLYKNGELIFEFENNSDISKLYLNDYFVTKDYIYILMTRKNILEAIKIDKKTHEEKDVITLLSDEKKNIKYIATLNNLVYLIIDNEIYTFDQSNDSLNKLNLNFYNIENYGTYNNYIYFYADVDDFNYRKSDLVLYNVETKKTTTLNDVLYYTIDDSKLYIVQDNDKLEFSYYDID